MKRTPKLVMQHRGPARIWAGLMLSVVLALSGCSKSDSSRSGSTEDESSASRSSSGDQDNSAFAPSDVAGAFLAAVMDCAGYVSDAIVMFGCNLINPKTGGLMLPRLASETRALQWILAVDGVNVAPVGGNYAGQSGGTPALRLDQGRDSVWTLGSYNLVAPGKVVPRLRLTRLDGTVLENRSLSDATIKGLTDGSMVQSLFIGGKPLSNPNLPIKSPGPNLTFATRDSFVAPHHILADHEIMQTYSGTCPEILDANRNQGENSRQNARLGANALCNCVARNARMEAVRKKAGQFYAILNTDETLEKFVQRSREWQSTDLFDTKGYKIAEAKGLFGNLSPSGSLVVQSSMPIAFDEHGEAFSSGTAGDLSVLAWTGIPPLNNNILSGTGFPDCMGWEIEAEGPNSRQASVGQIGRPGLEQFHYGQNSLCEGAKNHYYCASR